MKILSAIGMMSGTSMDGIDIAWIKSDGEQEVFTVASKFIAYSQRFQKLLQEGLEDALEITERSQRPGNLHALEMELTHIHTTALAEFVVAENINAKEIDLIGFHGHTVLHKPEIGLTVQLGNGENLASETGIETVYDLRAHDMVQGGQGAPLVPVYHEVLARQLTRDQGFETPMVFVNIGGISNVTYIADNHDLIAFDCGPGNALIDQWVQTRSNIAFDQDGQIAANGSVNLAITAAYLSHNYFDKPVPKSLDRLDFFPLLDEAISTSDGARTLAHITARSIANSATHFPKNPVHWIICGGGAKNPVIMAELETLMNKTGAKVHRAQDLGIDSDAVEAQAFAYLAIRSKLGLDITYPTTTGCHKKCSGGVIFNPAPNADWPAIGSQLVWPDHG